MNIFTLLETLRRRWYIPLLCALLGALAGWGASKATAPQYESTARLFTAVSSEESASELAAGLTYMKLQVNSYPQMVTSTPVLTKVIDKAGLDQTPSELAQKITVDVPVDTTWLNITASDDDPKKATALARAVAEESKTAIEDLEARGATKKPVVVTIVDPGSTPEEPGGPSLLLPLGGGALVGLVLGLLGLVLSWLRSPQAIRGNGNGYGNGYGSHVDGIDADPDEGAETRLARAPRR
ncbi:YveK family protein [Actinomycetota bacterium]